MADSEVVERVVPDSHFAQRARYLGNALLSERTVFILQRADWGSSWGRPSADECGALDEAIRLLELSDTGLNAIYNGPQPTGFMAWLEGLGACRAVFSAMIDAEMVVEDVDVSQTLREIRGIVDKVRHGQRPDNISDAIKLFGALGVWYSGAARKLAYAGSPELPWPQR